MHGFEEFLPLLLRDQFVYFYSIAAFLSFMFSFTPVLTYGRSLFYKPNTISLIGGAFGFSALLGFFLQVFFIGLGFAHVPYVKNLFSLIPFLSLFFIFIYTRFYKPHHVALHQKQHYALKLQHHVLYSDLKSLLILYQSLIYKDSEGGLCIGSAYTLFDRFLQKKIRYALRDLHLPEYYQDPLVYDILKFDACYSKAQEIFSPLKTLKTEYEWKKTLQIVLDTAFTQTLSLRTLPISKKSFFQQFSKQTMPHHHLNTLSLKETILEKEIRSVISGKDFEKLCQSYLHALGWCASLTKTTGDFGADIVAEKNNKKVIIQCKFYKKSIGLEAVQEIYSAISLYQADHGLVIGKTKYTKGAQKLAQSNNILLLHLDELSHLDVLIFKNY